MRRKNSCKGRNWQELETSCVFQFGEQVMVRVTVHKLTMQARGASGPNMIEERYPGHHRPDSRMHPALSGARRLPEESRWPLAKWTGLKGTS